MVVKVLDQYGEIRTEHDFLQLQIHRRIATALRNAYIALHGKNSVETRNQAWRCLKRFCYFMSSSELSEREQLPQDTLQRYTQWLLSQTLVNSTRQSQLNIVIALLTWIKRNAQDVLERNFILRAPSFSRNEPNTLPALDAATLKKILAAAYVDIDAAVSRITGTRKILETDEINASSQDLKILLLELLQIGNGEIPSERIVNRSKNRLARRVGGAGGLRSLRALLSPTPEDIFAFYVAILAQTGGNPMAIRDLSRDAVRDDVLRGDRKRVVWTKPRSHSEQTADFGIHRPRSAPNLIAQLLSLNSSLVPLAAPRDKEKLFLNMNASGRVGISCYQGFHNMLGAFIERHSLPMFEFKQLRKTVGTLHEQAGNIFVAQKKLNHKKIRTTYSYTKNDLVAEENDQAILRFQGELVRDAIEPQPRERAATSPIKDAKVNKPFNTVFGFICKSPYSGLAPNSTVGQPCPSFTSCSTCPGAVVPLDNPKIVARLFNAREALIEIERAATLEGWLERFQELYRPTLLVLENDLLPKVSPEIAAIAKKMVVPPMLPTFE